MRHKMYKPTKERNSRILFEMFFQKEETLLSLDQKNTYLKRYGLDVEKFYNVLEEQNFECLICEREFNDKLKPVVDHCHKHGHTRGLLCNSCNVGLGCFKDDRDILYRAIAYLHDNQY